MANVIRISFKKNSFEKQLYEDIKEECKLFGDSAWMKAAAYEKIQRDRNKVVEIDSNQQVQQQSVNHSIPFQQIRNTSANRPNKPIINSLEDIM